MFDTQLIHSVLLWERSLEIEEQKRKSRRWEDDPTAFPSAQPVPAQRRSIFAWIFKSSPRRQPVYPCQAQDPCPEAR